MLGAYRLRLRSIEARSRELERQVEQRTTELSRTNVLLQQQIEERQRAEEALAQERADAAVLEERNRLARELHDSVTQALYGVTLYAEAAKRMMSSGQVHQAEQHVHDLGDTAQEALTEMRLLIFELRPLELQEQGLVAVLQSRLEAVEGRAGLRTEFNAQGVTRMPDAVEEALYRIAREALNNALKHARASTVTVSLSQHEGSVRMEITDDGMGFDPANVGERGGLGMRSMTERAQVIGGRLEIESEAGGGTRVTVLWEEDERRMTTDE
jgi:signal transduction histidine kinase